MENFYQAFNGIVKNMQVSISKIESIIGKDRPEILLIEKEINDLRIDRTTLDRPWVENNYLCGGIIMSNREEMLENDRKYYIGKLKQAIILLEEYKDTTEICKELDLQYKEYEYIVDGM